MNKYICYINFKDHFLFCFHTTGSDGQQQCLLVTSEVAEAMETASGQPEQPSADVATSEINESLTEPLSVKTEADANDQVVAQVVRAEPPSPGEIFQKIVRCNFIILLFLIQEEHIR